MMMRPIHLCIGLLLTASCSMAQTPDDALRSAWFTPNGTARNIATGGVMGSLGGDLTANNVNPAGIGLYKTRELVLTPGFFFNSNKANYRDSSTSRNRNAFAYGASGFIFGKPRGRDSKWTSTAFSISVNQLASYNNHVAYNGFNNRSSYSEQYLEELQRDGADETAAYNNYINGASLAFGTYLIDTLLGPAGNLAGYQSRVPVSTGIYQSYDARTTGGYHEVSFAFAGNMADKLYLGASINLPIVSYHRDLYYRETDASGNPNNQFNYFEYREQFKSSGVGINAKLGMIYKPTDFLRLGLALHTPSYLSFKDQLRSTITTDTEGYKGVLTQSSDDSEPGRNYGDPVIREYYQLTPWRAIFSGSYVIRQVEDTRNQRGFISADIEYVNYRGSRYYATNNQDQSASDYYNSANAAIKGYLKSAFNFRLGGELKFDPWMFRLGAAYYGSPYSDSQLKASRLMGTGGIGYRNHGIFIDLAYAYTLTKDVNFPYRLNDKANTFAETKNNRSNLVLTVGFKI